MITRSLEYQRGRGDRISTGEGTATVAVQANRSKGTAIVAVQANRSKGTAIVAVRYREDIAGRPDGYLSSVVA